MNVGRRFGGAAAWRVIQAPRVKGTVTMSKIARLSSSVLILYGVSACSGGEDDGSTLMQPSTSGIPSAPANAAMNTAGAAATPSSEEDPGAEPGLHRENGALVFADQGASRPPEKLSYYGGETFGFRDTLVIFEKAGGAVTRLRVDTGTGHNVLAREVSSSAPR